MIKIAIAGIITMLISQLFKENKNMLTLVSVLAGSVLILVYSISKFEVIYSQIKSFKSYFENQNENILILIKIIGITYISEFSADLCKDSGFITLANQITLAGKLTIMAISIPIMISLINTLSLYTI